ncbi:MAG: oxidoreductase, FAD-binding protein [Actinomycetia bacterium]|nr:oxidoreductase, FAD-binding protein [Actinomycetes bacterium]
MSRRRTPLPYPVSGGSAIGPGTEGDETVPVPRVYDVAVIGAGIVGAAIARELTGHDLSVAVLEARGDVGDATSKANTAILHTGFDAKPGTLESRLVRRGYHLLSGYARATGIPVEQTGALLVAWTGEELQALPGLKEKAEKNGYQKCEILTADAVYRQVPALGDGVLGGLTVPDESIICTWTTNLALATEAKLRGADILLHHVVTGADVGADHTNLHTSAGTVSARWVINAAGLGADTLDRLFGYDRFTVTPRRGELFVFDKLARPLVNRIVLPVPTSRGKGVLVAPTIYGNVMLGPTAEDLTDRTATGTSEPGFEFLLSKGEKLMPRLLAEEITASYAGLRAAIDRDDYLIEATADRRYLLVGGIRSTGLTAGMAIAEHVRDLIAEAGLTLVPRGDLPDPPRMPNLGEAYQRPYQDAELIAKDEAYGRIVCFCERVTAGEIRDAFASPLPPCTLEGLRRRTRVMNGRCQGFFCGAEVTVLLGRQATGGTEPPSHPSPTRTPSSHGPTAGEVPEQTPTAGAAPDQGGRPDGVLGLDAKADVKSGQGSKADARAGWRVQAGSDEGTQP